MQQIVLLFRKDLRHFWPEVLFAFVAVALHVWWYPYTWRTHEHFPYQPLGMNIAQDALGSLPVLGLILLPISWLVMIGRVVQDESLVGNRQYWVTRPIAWQKLLAVKAIFFLLFLVVPFFCSFLVLLARAGFAIVPNRLT